MKKQIEIDYSFRGILIGLALFVMGIYVLIYANGDKFLMQNLNEKEKKAFYFAITRGFAIGFFALYWFKNKLAFYGYNTDL